MTRVIPRAYARIDQGNNVLLLADAAPDRGQQKRAREGARSSHAHCRCNLLRTTPGLIAHTLAALKRAQGVRCPCRCPGADCAQRRQRPGCAAAFAACTVAGLACAADHPPALPRGAAPGAPRAHRPRHPRRCGGGSRSAGLGPRRWARLRVPIGSAAHHVPGRSPSACSGRSLRRPPHAPLGRRSGHCPGTAAHRCSAGRCARSGRLLVCSCAQGSPLRGAARPCAPCAHSRLF